MSLADLTEYSIYEAVAEFDRLGRDAFLETHGFGRAKAWYLVVGDKRYDSKAIAGYAHGIATGDFWRSGDFTGGEQSVAARVTKLGFDVIKLTTEELAHELFGEIPGQPVGSTYSNRAELHAASVHRPLQAGIAGTARNGAESIVVSGGYEDDEDLGDVIIYTGHGGRDASTGRHTTDQSIDASGNAALITSSLQGGLVRVVRGKHQGSPFAPDVGFRYDGLFRVDSWWTERGASGFRVCRYRLTKASAELNVAEIAPDAITSQAPDGNISPARVTTSVQRIIRSGPVAEHVKRLYDHTCQMCETRLTIAGRGYSEAAHIRAIGRPHNGPDVASNMLCLCPNCHVLFDNGAVLVHDDFSLVWATATGRTHLYVADQHDIDLNHIASHRGRFVSV